ncbi:unnamed protein product [Lactuca virosa]|uniref:Importin N-terminal domain-containing protein n=1 Tax=Lactuca virosa TaxID=75947 RepID=A0AAU9LT67_9ASTR|nr:unnamed protein product [Lactuca virosa]
MDWNPQTPQVMSQSFLYTLFPQPEIRRHAEEKLSYSADTPNYNIAVLSLVVEPSIDEQTRQYVVVNFTNHLKTRWMSSSDIHISDGEKEKIRTLIVPVMLSATRKIQDELSEAIAVIGDHDFPEFWQVLLPEFESSLEMAISSNDFTSVNNILAIVCSLFKRFCCGFNSLFKKFRYQPKRNNIMLDLIYCSDNFATLLLSTIQSISRKINIAAAAGSVATIRQLLEARRLCCRIFYSLNVLDVPEKFEEKADE